jgi:transcriptional regulator with XRE-family HTH domain
MKTPLYQLRLSKGITRERLAIDTDIPYSTLRFLELGLIKRDCVWNKYKLSRYFKIPFFDLFPEDKKYLMPIIEDYEKIDPLCAHRGSCVSSGIRGRIDQSQNRRSPNEN